MIETGMIFALGFLAAALLALLVLPALSRRAERLARRRVEARLPLSMAEIAAERDHVRAEMAVEARRVEMRAEAAARARADDMAELGRRAVLIADLQAETAARADRIAQLEADLASTRAALEERSAGLESTGATLKAAQEDLAARQGELEALRRAHAALEEQSEERRLVISTLETAQEGLRARLADAERGLAQARVEVAERDARVRELDTLRATLEHKAQALAEERDARDRALESLRAERQASADEGAALRAELEQTRARLDAATLRAEAALASAERMHTVDAVALSERADLVEKLRTEKAAADGALDASRTERRALQQEIEAMRRGAEGEEEPAAGRPERRRVRLTAVGSEPAKPAASG